VKTFTIDNETNNITMHATSKEAEVVPDSERFGSEAALAKIAAKWPASRLIEIWNRLAGESPVKKFKDRATAVSRIWKATQRLGQSTQAAAEEPTLSATSLNLTISEGQDLVTATSAAPQTSFVALKEVPARDKAARANKSHRAAATRGVREGSKTEAILALIRQPGGTTLKAIMETTQWQAHSVRGFISGTLGRKMRLTVLSAKSESGERTYSITA
jgi:hypothetical protein